MIDLWNDQLSEAGSKIIYKRYEFINEICKIASEKNKIISGKETLKMQYDSGTFTLEEMGDVDFTNKEEICRKMKMYLLQKMDKEIYCNYIANNTEVADAYAEGNLGISKYEYAKDGMNWPIYECPECGEESFVLQSIDSEGYCTSCEYKSIPYEYQFCDECYKLIKDSEEGICYSCLQDKINKDSNPHMVILRNNFIILYLF